MADTNLIMTLAKVIAAAAWADGQVTPEEVDRLKELLHRIPNVPMREWAVLDMYLDDPVDEAERARLVAELRQSITSTQDKELVRATLKDLINADGVVTADEQRVVQEVESAIESVEAGFIGGLRQLVKDMVDGRSPAIENAPNREEQLEDFINNKVYYFAQRRLERGQAELDIPEEKLRKLCLAGGLMARIARVSAGVTEAEVSAMVDSLQAGWHTTAEEANFVIAVAVSDTAADLDTLHLTNRFIKVCTRQECVEFLDVLFAIATVDGEASFDEIEEIRRIARGLNLPNNQFVRAKLNVPSEQRQE